MKPFEFNYKMEESIYLHFKYLQALKIATIPLHLQYICLLENNLHLSLCLLGTAQNSEIDVYILTFTTWDDWKFQLSYFLLKHKTQSQIKA